MPQRLSTVSLVVLLIVVGIVVVVVVVETGKGAICVEAARQAVLF